MNNKPITLENEIQTVCPKIANILCKLIPEKWSIVYLYAGLTDTSETVIFYYYTDKKNKPVYSLDILDKYSLNESYFFEMNGKLYDYFKNLRQTFEKYGQKKWTTATFILKNTGKMKLDFDYNPLSLDDHLEDQRKWEYKYLGLHD